MKRLEGLARMRISRLSRPLVVALALGLSACVTHQPMIPTSEVSYVDKVDVRLGPKVTSARIADAVRAKTRREATRYGRAGAVKELRISVESVHYKNPVASLVIGDANHIKAHVAVHDAASGRAHGEFEATAVDSFAINGVVGAVMAATQDEGNVDQRLAEGLASHVLERVYGTAAATEARNRAPVEIVEAPPAVVAPAAKPKSGPAKPVAPKSVPVAKQSPAPEAGPKTAMATGPAPLPATR